MQDSKPLQIGVIGGTRCDDRLRGLAEEVGRRIAARGATLICGGRGGVMEAACRGARRGGGSTVGILPGVDAEDSPPNPFLDVCLFTGLGQARNLCVVLSSDALIALGGGWGTLSEIALAGKHGVPVVLLHSWSAQSPDGSGITSLEGQEMPRAEDAAEAVEKALQSIAASRQRIFPDTV